jgi:hypothetical protein
MLECILRCLTLLFENPSLLLASSQSTLKDLRVALTVILQDGSINPRVRATVERLLTTLRTHIPEGESDVEEASDSEPEFER